jgi:hypothetical protein
VCQTPSQLQALTGTEGTHPYALQIRAGVAVRNAACPCVPIDEPPPDILGPSDEADVRRSDRPVKSRDGFDFRNKWQHQKRPIMPRVGRDGTDKSFSVWPRST